MRVRGSWRKLTLGIARPFSMNIAFLCESCTMLDIHPLSATRPKLRISTPSLLWRYKNWLANAVRFALYAWEMSVNILPLKLIKTDKTRLIIYVAPWEANVSSFFSQCYLSLFVSRVCSSAFAVVSPRYTRRSDQYNQFSYSRSRERTLIAHMYRIRNRIEVK